jgi:hypothetical protein
VLALLLQSVEKSLGHSLAFAASLAFWVGLLMVLYVIAAPAARIALDMGCASIGLARHWVMQCPTCKHTVVVSGANCENCGKSLDIPWPIRIRNFLTPEVEPQWWRYLRWTWTIIGMLAFAIVTVFALARSGAWSPQSGIEKLFVGLALVAWAALGWFVARAIGMNTGGLLSRSRDAVLALFAAVALAGLVALAEAARPVEEVELARATVQGQVAQVNGQSVPLVGYQLGFEYLQIDHELGGYHEVIPLAIVGSQSIPLIDRPWRQRLADHLWQHAEAYTARGLSVRRRSEQVIANAPGVYVIVLRGRELLIRPYALPNNQ